MHKTSLTEIANKYATDKGTMGPTEKWPANNYTDIYDSYLNQKRDEPITLLEIGLGVTGDAWESYIVQGRNKGGASINMWYEYFPNARIFGIDVNSAPYLDNDRTSTYVCDQGNKN